MMTKDDLAAALEEWIIGLKAVQKSPKTVHSYREGVTQWLKWCEKTGTVPELTQDCVNKFLVYLMEGKGVRCTTARTRQIPLRRFSAWLFKEGDLTRDELATSDLVRIDRKPVPIVEEDQKKALLKVCSGTDFTDYRDTAILRVLFSTGIRAEECLQIKLSDFRAAQGEVIIRRGKGGKPRTVYIGPKASEAVLRYIRKARKFHHLANISDALWLGSRGRTFGYSAMQHTLKDRAKQAGIPHFHIHMTRHTFSTEFLDKGGSVQDLMNNNGWTSPNMAAVYTKTGEERRAMQAARKLNLDDF